MDRPLEKIEIIENHYNYELFIKDLFNKNNVSGVLVIGSEQINKNFLVVKDSDIKSTVGEVPFLVHLTTFDLPTVYKFTMQSQHLNRSFLFWFNSVFKRGKLKDFYINVSCRFLLHIFIIFILYLGQHNLQFCAVRIF